MEQPAENWTAADFDDSIWQEGPGGFGTEGHARCQASAPSGTRETSGFAAPSNCQAMCLQRIALRIHHDEDAEVYCNGVRVAQFGGYTTQYETPEISPAALRPGRNVIAIHCRQTDGGQYIDAGLDAIVTDAAASLHHR